MLSISTSWNSSLHTDAAEMIRQLCALGTNTIELGFSLTESIVRAISEARQQGLLRVSSIHNFCPVPNGFDRFSFTPDYFSLSSPNEEERAQAVSLTKRSLETAKNMNASALVIHAGRVAMAQRTKELAEMLDQGLKNSPAYTAIMRDMIDERKRKKDLFLSAVKRSIEELLKYAQEIKIPLCLENRYYYREIPLLDEIGDLLDTFGDTEYLGYWHDVGHAQVSENLGFSRHIDFLARYGTRMVGVHLHDVIGGHDHKVPGKGNFNFSILKPYLKKNTIKVVEVHQPASIEEMKTGIDFLNGILSINENIS